MGVEPVARPSTLSGLISIWRRRTFAVSRCASATVGLMMISIQAGRLQTGAPIGGCVGSVGLRTFIRGSLRGAIVRMEQKFVPRQRPGRPPQTLARVQSRRTKAALDPRPSRASTGAEVDSSQFPSTQAGSSHDTRRLEANILLLRHHSPFV